MLADSRESKCVRFCWCFFASILLCVDHLAVFSAFGIGFYFCWANETNNHKSYTKWPNFGNFFISRGRSVYQSGEFPFTNFQKKNIQKQPPHITTLLYSSIWQLLSLVIFSNKIHAPRISIRFIYCDYLWLYPFNWVRPTRVLINWFGNCIKTLTPCVYTYYRCK